MARTLSSNLREAIYQRDNYRCVKCGLGDRPRLQVHHIIPVGDGGQDTEFNLITLCEKCHRYAPNDPIEFIHYCARHLSPEMARSADFAKLIIIILLKEKGMQGGDDWFLEISDRVDRLFYELWKMALDPTIESLEKFLENAVRKDS